MDGKVIVLLGLLFLCMMGLSSCVASVALSYSSNSSTSAPSSGSPSILGGSLGTSSTPGPFSISDYFSESVASPAWCRVQGGTRYTGYTGQYGDADACKRACIADPRCTAVEADGKECWFYSGEEYSQTATATEAGHACYKLKSRPDQSVYGASFNDSVAKPAWCRNPGEAGGAPYFYASGDTNICKSTCWVDAKCKAVESDEKTCWYYGGNEVSTSVPSNESVAKEGKSQCFRKK